MLGNGYQIKILKFMILLLVRIQLKWNSATVDWINSTDSINEVGCIHTTQGYDLNYTGIIMGPELDYDFASGKFIVDKKIQKTRTGEKFYSERRRIIRFHYQHL